MPRKVKSTQTSARGNHRKTRRSAKSLQMAERRRTARKQAVTVQARRTGRLAGKLVEELAQPILRSVGGPAMSRAEAPEREGVGVAAARITGGALALGSMLVTAPFLLFAASTSGSRERDDLKRREYRDETGTLHHHTRVYLRDHAGELRPAA